MFFRLAISVVPDSAFGHMVADGKVIWTGSYICANRDQRAAVPNPSNVQVGGADEAGAGGSAVVARCMGFSTEYELKKILKAFKKEFACNGCIVEHKEYGNVI